MKTKAEAEQAVARHADTVWRVCLFGMNNETDAQDVFQTVFMKYILYSGAFQSEEHEKAWLIRVAQNCCRDILKSFFRKRAAPLEEAANLAADTPEEYDELTSAVWALPKKYRTAVALFYYEGYSASEIATLLGQNENTVYTRLARARGLLKQALGGKNLV